MDIESAEILLEEIDEESPFVYQYDPVHSAR